MGDDTTWLLSCLDKRSPAFGLRHYVASYRYGTFALIEIEPKGWGQHVPLRAGFIFDEDEYSAYWLSA
jgi:hypothetical protein